MSASARSQADMLADLIVEGVERAGRAVSKALAALPPEAVMRCENSAIRSAVHEACQIMSDADDDRGGIANSVGWSKSTSHRGHWLSEMPELDAGLAAVDSCSSTATASNCGMT